MVIQIVPIFWIWFVCTFWGVSEQRSLHGEQTQKMAIMLAVLDGCTITELRAKIW
jgi:hypothetical protein